MRTVWIISEGSPGHLSQSAGLVAALQHRIPLAVQTIDCRPRLRGVARSLVRAWMGRRGRPLPRWVLRRWLGVEPLPPPEARPDLVLASGGKSVFAARTLASTTGAPLVFLGERKPYRSEWFHTVLTPSPSETGVNDVAIEMIPTAVSPGEVASAARDWSGRPGGRLWAMIIGGSSLSHRYTASDWKRLADVMNEMAEREGIRWLVTTSRRTGGEAEAMLRSRLVPAHLAYAVWWAQKPEKMLNALLGAAEVVFVTQDSVTMVTECVAAGKPTVVVSPTEVSFPDRSFLPAYFARLESMRRIIRQPIAAAATGHYLPAEFAPVTASVSERLAGLLIQRLGWPGPAPDGSRSGY